MLGRGRLPFAENLLDLRKHRFAREIANDNEQRVRGRIILPVEAFELLALVRRDLLFRWRNDRVGMLAENHAAKSFVREKTRRGAFDSQAFNFLAAFSFKLF